MFTTIIIFIAVLSVLVFVHELGHFWTAKKLGLAPKEFGFGFPPRIGGIYKNKAGKWHWQWGGKEVEDVEGTVYSINWLPLGGFVNLGEDEESGNDPKHFKNQKPWKRAIILSAGVFMNLVIAAVFIAWGYMIGLPQAIDENNQNANITDQRIQIMQVLPDSPADKAKLQLGDIIASINEQEFKTYEELQNFISDKEGVELNYKIKRGEQELNFQITPEPIEVNENIPGVGIAIAETGIVSYPWYRAIWEGIYSTILMTWFIIVAFATLIKSLITGAGIGAEVAGPVGIAVMTGQVAQLGFVYLLQFTAVLSINLAIINFLPLPALDGGRVLFLIIEKIRGKAVPERIEAMIHNIGFTLLMLLVLVVTYRDVIKFSDKFINLFHKIF